MVKPYCSQSSLTFSGLSSVDLLRSFLHDYLASIFNSMFVRLGTDYEIRNGGYFKTIKNSADQFRYGSFQMARIVEDG